MHRAHSKDIASDLVEGMLRGGAKRRALIHLKRIKRGEMVYVNCSLDISILGHKFEEFLKAPQAALNAAAHVFHDASTRHTIILLLKVEKEPANEFDN